MKSQKGENSQVIDKENKKDKRNNLPLIGIRVIDLGQLIAAPFAATLLGDFGAEVIKVELPGIGDNIRELGPQFEDIPLWWAIEGRNKKSITLDLRQKSGQEIFKRLAAVSDVLIENYLPGTLEKWNLGPEELKFINPQLVIIRVSGFGQTGPYKERYGYDRIALGVGGVLYISGYPNMPPVRPGIAWGDYTAGLFSAFAAMVALYYRDIQEGRIGQIIDVALYECVFRLLEYCVPQYYFLGEIRERTGNLHPATAPGNTYATKDNQWVVVACTNNRVFQRLTKIMDREDLIIDFRFKDVPKRVKHQYEIDKIVGEWIKNYTLEEILQIFNEGGIPATSIYSIKDIFEDPHYHARNNILEVEDKLLGKVKMQGVVPKFSLTPGEVKNTGPTLGEHNKEIYENLLRLTPEEIAYLQKNNII